jgi:hypothetical protein
VAVDHDLQVWNPGRAGGGGAHVRAGLLAGPGRLPEDGVAAAGLREHQLGTVLPGTVQHQVDRGAPADAGPQRHPLDDVGFFRPLVC